MNHRDDHPSELEAYADLVAERLAVLGGVTQGMAHLAATQSMLPEYPSDPVEGNAHVLALTERFASYATVLRAGISHAADVEDAGNAAVYTDICQPHRDFSRRGRRYLCQNEIFPLNDSSHLLSGRASWRRFGSSGGGLESA